MKILCLHAGPYLPILTAAERDTKQQTRGKIQNGGNKTSIARCR